MAKWLENYNESKVTLPEGFVGMGNNTQGRNYSPAWGGQFQDGGNLWNTDKTAWVDSIHNARKADLNFVQRMFDQKAGSIQIPGQRGTSTHFMESGDGKAYPTVVQMPNGKLQYLNQNDKDAAWKYANKTGQFIKFPTDEQAAWYADNGYKKGTGVLKKHAMGGSIPGAVGFTYARTQDPAPSNGKYAKKTKASAQSGKKVVPSKEILASSSPTRKKEWSAPEEDKINDWFKQYYGSDFFKQNLADASKGIINVDPNEVSKNAINAVDNTFVINPKTDEGMTYSFPGAGGQYIVMGNPNVYGNQPRNETYAHEMGHTHGLELLASQPRNLFFMDNHAIGKKEYADELYKDLTAPIRTEYGPEFKSEDHKRKRVLSDYAQKEEDLGMVNHGKAQTEQRADIMALRYLAAKKGIWDASKSKPGSFTPEMLNKLYKTKEVNTPITRYSTLGGGKRTDEIDPNDIKQGNLKNVAPPKTPGTILPELRRKFSDKDILYLMNKLAKNEGNVPVDQAQNGQEMKYYQDGLDFRPKTISKNGSVIKDNRGQWAHPGEITEIGSNEITMQGVDYPVLGISDTGDTQMMYPDQDYKFDGDKVTEYPMAQDGKKFSMEDVKRNAMSNKYPSAKQMKGTFSKGKEDSDIENVFEIIDPTGISSWDDVADSYRETGISPQTTLEVLGAIPLFGKASKLTQKGIHLTKYKGLDKALYNTLPKSAKLSKSLNAASKFGRGSDAYQAYDQKQNGGWLNKYK